MRKIKKFNEITNCNWKKPEISEKIGELFKSGKNFWIFRIIFFAQFLFSGEILTLFY
jgi:hypothetical protein